MDLKEKWLADLMEFRKDMVFFNRFAMRDDAYLPDFMEALQKNEIMMRGNEKKVHYGSFLDIDFLGPEIKHPEWVQQLNRFYWLKYCAIEYEKSKSDHMATLVHDAITAWMEYWPFYGDRKDIYEWMCCDLFHPMISTPLRLGAGAGHGWIGCLPYFFDHPLFTDEFIEKAARSALWQIGPMVRNNKYHSGEHNWRPNELSSLLFLSQVLPGAEKYTEYAVEQINDAFYAQYEEDGTHIEHTADYHDWMTDIFALTYILGHNRPELEIKIEPEKILRSLDYSIQCKAPDGRQFGIHDSYAWHPDNPVDSGRMTDIRNYIAELTGAGSYEKKYSGALDFCFPDAQQYFFRNGSETPVREVYFDASRWGSWHCHRSCNSLNFFYGNKMLLIDPGSLDYGNSKDRWYGKLTPAHNTITVNNLSQTNMSDPLIREYKADEDAVFMISDYTGGYQNWCGPESNRPAYEYFGSRQQVLGAHERLFLWIRNRFIFVFDSVNLHENTEVNEISSHWQFLKGDVVHEEGTLSAHTCFEDYNVMVKNIYTNVPVESNIHCGRSEPMLGYNSRTGGKLSGVTPAPMLSYDAKTDSDMVRMAQVIIPYGGGIPPKVSASYKKTRYAILFSINIDNEKYDIASHYFVREYFKTNSPIREIGEYDSMARLFARGDRDGLNILDWEYGNSKK